MRNIISNIHHKIAFASSIRIDLASSKPAGQAKRVEVHKELQTLAQANQEATEILTNPHVNASAEFLTPIGKLRIILLYCYTKIGTNDLIQTQQWRFKRRLGFRGRQITFSIMIMYFHLDRYNRTYSRTFYFRGLRIIAQAVEFGWNRVSIMGSEPLAVLLDKVHCYNRALRST